MNPSGESVLPGPSLTGGKGIRDEHKNLDRMYEKQICLYILKEHLASLQFF